METTVTSICRSLTVNHKQHPPASVVLPLPFLGLPNTPTLLQGPPRKRIGEGPADFL